MHYQKRLIDTQLDTMLKVLPAIALEGAKGVGKTATGMQRADSVFTLDDPATAQIVEGNPSVLNSGDGTTFIDEWQLVPSVWNTVRRAVDNGASPGRYLLAGSANPRPEARIHSGAGRIVRLLMRPLSFPERGIETPTVSFADLLNGNIEQITGKTSVELVDYVNEIKASGFPGIRNTDPEAQQYLIESYVDRIIDHDIEEMGAAVRRPASLRGWLEAYGAATATTTSYSALLKAATPGQDDKPSKTTAITYRDLLQRLFVLDPLPAWLPSATSLNRLGQAPKHHLVDPALAAHFSGLTNDALIRGAGPELFRQEGPFLGALFESLAAQTVRVLAQSSRAKTYHFRNQGGAREIDMIVERPDKKILAIEVKLSGIVRPTDVRNLNWLEESTNNLVIDKVLINTGSYAYRRPDGVAVIPLSLLGV